MKDNGHILSRFIGKSVVISRMYEELNGGTYLMGRDVTLILMILNWHTTLLISWYSGNIKFDLNLIVVEKTKMETLFLVLFVRSN